MSEREFNLHWSNQTKGNNQRIEFAIHIGWFGPDSEVTLYQQYKKWYVSQTKLGKALRNI